MNTKAYFENKVIWITGASSGIGKEFCIQLDQMGAILILSSRNEDSLLKLKESLSHSKKHQIQVLDLEDSSKFSSITDSIISNHKKIDLLMKEVSSGVILMPPPLVLLILGTGEFVDKLSPSMVGVIYGMLSGLGVSFLVIRSKVLEIENAEFIKASKYVLEIPQVGTKHSLNVSVAAGIVLWDFYQKSFNL